MRVIRLTTAVALALISAHAAAADKLKLQLDWMPNGGDKAFVFVGVQEGFYAAEGLDVTILPGRGSSDTLTKIASGAADVGTGGIASLMMAQAEGGIPVKAIMSIYSKQPDAIYSWQGSGVTDMKSLKGKTLGIPTFSASNALLPIMLENNGVDPDSVKQIKADPGTLVPMLAQGRVDGVVVWSTNRPSIEATLTQVGKKPLELAWTDYGLDGYGLSFFASDKLIKEKPDVVARFVRASKKSIEFSLAHPDKAAADQKAMVPEADVAMLEADFNVTKPLINNEISQRDGLGQFDPTLLQHTWEWVAKSMKYSLDKVNPETLVDRSYLAK